MTDTPDKTQVRADIIKAAHEYVATVNAALSSAETVLNAEMTKHGDIVNLFTEAETRGIFAEVDAIINTIGQPT